MLLVCRRTTELNNHPTMHSAITTWILRTRKQLNKTYMRTHTPCEHLKAFKPETTLMKLVFNQHSLKKDKLAG